MWPQHVHQGTGSFLCSLPPSYKWKINSFVTLLMPVRGILSKKWVPSSKGPGNVPPRPSQRPSCCPGSRGGAWRVYWRNLPSTPFLALCLPSEKRGSRAYSTPTSSPAGQVRALASECVPSRNRWKAVTILSSRKIRPPVCTESAGTQQAGLCEFLLATGQGGHGHSSQK